MDNRFVLPFCSPARAAPAFPYTKATAPLARRRIGNGILAQKMADHHGGRPPPATPSFLFSAGCCPKKKKLADPRIRRCRAKNGRRRISAAASHIRISENSASNGREEVAVFQLAGQPEGAARGKSCAAASSRRRGEKRNCPVHSARGLVDPRAQQENAT